MEKLFGIIPSKHISSVLVVNLRKTTFEGFIRIYILKDITEFI